MKTFIVLCALAVVVFGRPEEKYTDMYDNVNVDEILENDRLLESFYKCLMDLGKCTADAKELKSHTADALETGCSKCTEIQKKESRHVIGFIINNKPEYWKELTAKYDKDGKYTAKYEDELKTLKA